MLSNYESFYKVQTSISAFSRVEKMASESVEGPNFLRCVVPARLLNHPYKLEVPREMSDYRNYA